MTKLITSNTEDIMKKILFSIAALVSGLVLLSSCSDFLKEEPKSSLTLVDYFKSESDIVGNVNYLYRTGAPTFFASTGAYDPSRVALTSILTGYFVNVYEGQELHCAYSRLLTRQEKTQNVSNAMDDIWDGCYRAINNANGVIIAIPDIVKNGKMSAANGDKYDAEARFFRAFNYMMLVKFFGDVPMTEDFLYDLSFDTQLPRSPKKEVLDLIEKDLAKAASKLPDASFAANGHRVTKWVAEAALTDVLFWQGKYSEAATEAKKIIQSPKVTLTKNEDTALKSAYNKLRSTDDLDEVIYAYEFNASISTSSYTPTHAFDGQATNVFDKYSIFERCFGPTNRYLNVYEPTDLRIQPNQFFHWSYTRTDDGRTWNPPAFTPGFMDGFTNIDFAGMGYQYPGNWYYYDETAILETGQGTKDWNIYRYPEILLDAAESIAQSEGVTNDAADYLAQVQSRAFGKTVAELTTANKALSKDEFIKACWMERLREFPFEYKIWDDCVRTGKFPNISKTVRGKVDFVNLIGAVNGSDATFKESDLLWPISINEMQRNANLRPQNPGYKEK